MPRRSNVKLTDEFSFVKGEVYFFVTYPDTTMCYPLVESYVYLGKNLSEEDLQDTWYFQWASDFVKYGSALEGIERPVYCAKVEELLEFQNGDQLASTIRLTAARRDANSLATSILNVYYLDGHLLAEADGATGAVLRDYIWLPANDNSRSTCAFQTRLL